MNLFQEPLLETVHCMGLLHLKATLDSPLRPPDFVTGILGLLSVAAVPAPRRTEETETVRKTMAAAAK